MCGRLWEAYTPSGMYHLEMRSKSGLRLKRELQILILIPTFAQVVDEGWVEQRASHQCLLYVLTL